MIAKKGAQRSSGEEKLSAQSSQQPLRYDSGSLLKGDGSARDSSVVTRFSRAAEAGGGVSVFLCATVI